MMSGPDFKFRRVSLGVGVWDLRIRHLLAYEEGKRRPPSGWVPLYRILHDLMAVKVSDHMWAGGDWRDLVWAWPGWTAAEIEGAATKVMEVG